MTTTSDLSAPTSQVATSLPERGRASFEDDPRRLVRVFLASSSELREERECFPHVLARVNERPDLNRNVRIEAVLWETHAAGGDPGDINHAIARSVHFEALDLVVVVVWNKVGLGTAGEFMRALELWRLHDRPQLLVYARRPNAHAEPRNLHQVEEFLKAVVDANVVATRYQTVEQFIDRILSNVPDQVMKPDLDPEPADPPALRRWFTASSAVNVLLSAASIALVQMISYPSRGVSPASVLATLVAPVLLFLALMGNLFLYGRLLRGLRRVWHSRSWRDADLYAGLRHIVPGFCLPQQLRASVPRDVVPTLVAVFWLVLSFGAPVYAEGWVLFREIMTWNVVVGWAAHPGPDGREVSTYVDRGGIESWLLGLQNPAARRALEGDPDEISYVHAHGAFGSSGNSADNRGPQVWLPTQGRIYLLLLVTSIASVVAAVVGLARLPVMLMKPPRSHRPLC